MEQKEPTDRGNTCTANKSDEAPMFGSSVPAYSELEGPLDNLLTFVVEAHGGLNAWNKLRTLHAKVSIGSALWEQKGLPGIFKNTRVQLELPSQRVVTHLVDLDERIVFTPNHISLESESGKTLATRTDPRAAFAGQTANSKWDKLHAGYFCSYALWGYLTTPFLYTCAGFEAHEIEPWHENGERWRILQVTFPDGYAAHTRTQYSYFGEDGLLRRHLYTVDVLGGAPGANYAFEYREVNGVMVATQRRVLAYNDARQKIDEPILVSIDLSEIRFT